MIYTFDLDFAEHFGEASTSLTDIDFVSSHNKNLVIGEYKSTPNAIVNHSQQITLYTLGYLTKGIVLTITNTLHGYEAVKLNFSNTSLSNKHPLKECWFISGEDLSGIVKECREELHSNQIPFITSTDLDGIFRYE